MLVVSCTFLGSASQALASPIEVFGFGSRHAAQASAGVAAVDDFAATYYNPAGLAVGKGKQLTIGSLGAYSNLAIGDRKADAFTDPLGLVVGITAPAPLGGPLEGRLRLGLGMYLLPTTIAEVAARFPDEPFYPWYDNRLQRIVILPGAGVRITDKLTVGAAINFLAAVEGGIQAAAGSTRALEARVDEKVPSVARINAGITFQPIGQLRLGLAYRQRFEVPFTTLAKVEVAGEPIDLDLHASGQFTPNEIIVGGAWTQGPAVGRLDVVWSNWSEYPGPFVEVDSALPLVGPLDGKLPTVPYHDTIAVRMGGEISVGTTQLRGGYALETSPIPAEQTGMTNLLDGPKHTFGAGIGIKLPGALDGKDLRIDLHVQAQVLGPRTITKKLLGDGETYDPFTRLRDEVIDVNGKPETVGTQISNPGYPGIDSGGQVFSGGLTMEVDL